MNLSTFTISTNGFFQLQQTCELNSYRRTRLENLPSDFPRALLDKCAGEAVIIGSGDSINQAYMVNLLRVDKRELAIDQQPLIITSHKKGSVITLTAAFVNHGSWDGRTINIGTALGHEFVAAIQGSGIAQHYPLIGVPEKEKGSIHELKPDSHNHAFWTGVKAMSGFQ